MLKGSKKTVKGSKKKSEGKSKKMVKGSNKKYEGK